ncbi:DHA2 family efflux MFS transporter permease subunit [Streptococcus dentasini]
MEEHKQENTARASVHVDHPWLAMTSMLIGAFVGMLSETSLNIALPKLEVALNVGASSLQWLVTGYMLVIGIVLPLSSLISKWFTTRQTVIFAILAFICGAVISTLGSNFSLVLAGRMIQGIGTGLILPLMFTVAMKIFPMQKLGAAMGVNALVIMFAPAIGPTLTGLLLAKLSWRYIFWSFALILAVALIFALVFLKNVAELTKPKVDFLSVLSSIVGFGALVVGVSFASNQGWGSPIVLGALAIGILVLTFYTYRQLHLKNPILNLKIFTKPAFRIGAVLVMLDFAIILSTMYLFPQFIQNGMGLPVAMTGIIMLPGGLVNALVSAVSGRLYDNLGAPMPARLGFIIAIIGAVMLIFVTPASSVTYVIAAHIVLMIGCPLAMSPSQTHALNSLHGAESADGSTIMNTMQQIIGAIATALATSFLVLGQAHYHGSNHAAAFTNGIHYGFYFTLGLAIAGFLLALNLKSSRTK